MELFLTLSIVFAATFLLGKLLERIRIPWIFAALLIGVILSSSTLGKDLAADSNFGFMAQLGLFFTLFIIGFEIDLKAVRKLGGFIARMSTAVILTESVIGTILIYNLFDISLGLSMLVATSFATVGEAMLLPILDEFKLMPTRFGQTIVGVGVIDDIVEIATIIILTILIGTNEGHSSSRLVLYGVVLLLLFVLPLIVGRLKNRVSRWRIYGFEYFFLLAMAMFFLFVGTGSLIDAAPLGALLAGVAIKNFVSDTYIKAVESEVRTLAYGLFAPIFFLSVGLETDAGSLLSNPWLIILITAATAAGKIIASWFAARKQLGGRGSIVAGILLTVRLSTSIVVITLLYENGLIPAELFTVLVGSTIVFKFVIPIAVSKLIVKWRIGHPEIKDEVERRRKSMPLTRHMKAPTS